MFYANLICTDEDCAVEIEAWVERLAELDVLVCDGCECVLQVLAVAEAEPGHAPVVELWPATRLSRAA